MGVQCFLTAALAHHVPSERVAIVAIADPSATRQSFDGWGPSMVMRFKNEEFDAAYAKSNGWDSVEAEGLFVPRMRVGLRRFLTCDVVRECEDVFVCCDDGARSRAVGKFAAGVLGCDLFEKSDVKMNGTVYSLLVDPTAYDLKRRTAAAPQPFWAPLLWAVRRAAGGSERA